LASRIGVGARVNLTRDPCRNDEGLGEIWEEVDLSDLPRRIRGEALATQRLATPQLFGELVGGRLEGRYLQA
jgi:hypothetical protein